MGAKRSDREGDGVCYGAFVFVFAFAFSILPSIHLCTPWFSASLYLYFTMATFLTFHHHLSLFKFSPLSLSSLDRTEKKADELPILS